MNNFSFFINLAFVVAMLTLATMMFMKIRHTKASQNRLLQSLNGGDYNNWFRIRVARPSYFRRRLKLIGFESSGILANADDHVRLLAEFGRDGKFDMTYPKSDLQLEWIGNPSLASANMHWMSIGHAENRLLISADTGFNAVQSREATADICRMIVPSFRLPDAARADFALEKNHASLGAMVVFFALLAFAVIDGMLLNPYKLVKAGGSVWFFPALLVFAAPAYFALVRHRVPSRESLALSMLLVVSLTVAFVPALKRIDQALSTDGLQSYEYTLAENARLEAVSSDVPALHFSGTREYWAQFEPGSSHRFELLHGPLGMWQLDRRELDRKTRAFYQTRNDDE